MSKEDEMYGRLEVQELIAHSSDLFLCEIWGVVRGSDPRNGWVSCRGIVPVEERFACVCKWGIPTVYRKVVIL